MSVPDGLLFTGSSVAAEAATDDLTVLRAMLTAEVAWVRAQERLGLAPAGAGDGVDRAVSLLSGSDNAAWALVVRVAREASGAANPVIPLLARLRAEVAAVAPGALAAVHAGLTSQDVLDTALVLVLRDAAATVSADLTRAAQAAQRLARTHRDDPALAVTLAQAAVPTTLGARIAVWAPGLAAAAGLLDAVGSVLPLAYGGAAGELGAVAALAGGDPFPLVEAWGDELGLPVGPGPWHTTRTPFVRVAGAFAEACAALGHVAGDVLQGTRPGVGELREPAAPGRGTSSAMPHKVNPVLSVLVRRSAIAAPALVAQVLTAAGLAVDARPDGAWHAEWPALQQLARHALVAAAAGAELLEGLHVDPEAARRNLAAALPDADGVGAAPAIVDRVLGALATRASEEGS
ncbi:lyase family protein [Xylanimonas sp. McL0601]|uniref:lyase family protein n=1 Tax=Xylanimonas sp. McL0601 TaxID=3414739 RepID=UPI003CF60458